MRRFSLIISTLSLVSIFTLSAIFLLQNFIRENPITIGGNNILGDSIEREKNKIEKSIQIDLKNNNLSNNYLNNNSKYSTENNPTILFQDKSLVEMSVKDSQTIFTTIFSTQNSIVSYNLFDNLNFFYIEKIEPFGDQQLVITNLKSKNESETINLSSTSIQVYTDIYFDNQSKIIWLLSITREGRLKVEYINTKFEIIDFASAENLGNLKFIGKSENRLNFTSGNKCLNLDEELKIFSEVKCVEKLSQHLEHTIYAIDNRIDIYNIESNTKNSISLINPEILDAKKIQNKLYIHLQNEILIYEENTDSFERVSLRGTFLNKTFEPVLVEGEVQFLNLLTNRLYKKNDSELKLLETDTENIPSAKINTPISDSSILIFREE